MFVLIDSRHGLKSIDTDVLDGLDKAAVSYQVVLTKADASRRARSNPVWPGFVKHWPSARPLIRK